MKNNNVKLWLVGIAVAVLVTGGAYWMGSSAARGQMMGWQSPVAQIDPMVRIATALERIATAMEKPAGGMMGQMGPGMMGGMMGQGRSMGQMGDMSQMMGQMQERMQQCQTMMGQMQKMMGSMQPAAPVPSASAPAEAQLTRTSEAEGITVAVTFMNPLLQFEETGGKLFFKVALDTHTVDLSSFDLTKLAELRTSEGVIVNKGFIWEPISESGHHRMGLLKIDGTLNSVPIITKETKYIELELKEIGIPARLFKWEA